MRELTKSLSSFCWAMSLFTLQQTANLLSPARAAKAFDSATKASEDQLGKTLRSTFDVGDKLQRTAVDLTLGMMTGQMLNPNQWFRAAANVVRQSTEAVTTGVQSVGSTVQQAASQGVTEAATQSTRQSC
jgi:hypothetical protein